MGKSHTLSKLAGALGKGARVYRACTSPAIRGCGNNQFQELYCVTTFAYADDLAVVFPNDITIVKIIGMFDSYYKAGRARLNNDKTPTWP